MPAFSGAWEDDVWPRDFCTVAALLDGAEVTLRSLRNEDYDAVVALAADLDTEERYLRFFTAYPAHIGEWALSLTRPAEGFVALGVFETGELIGVANCADSSEPDCAEIAVVVAHEQHERGVGTALLQALGHIARDAGKRRLVAEVLCENYAMRKVISDAGWPVSQHRDGPVLSVEVDLNSVGRGSSTTA